jgi:hypothetical protein
LLVLSIEGGRGLPEGIRMLAQGMVCLTGCFGAGVVLPKGIDAGPCWTAVLWYLLALIDPYDKVILFSLFIGHI